VSQSPSSAVRRGRYEYGWDAINRFIREDGSWSGSERNCFHLACDDGSFADASAASGLDFIEDGRAFAVIDYDGDGDPDLLLRQRNGPRLRVLRNVFRSGNRSLWLHLSARSGNRDAVGARVELETEGGPRVKEVQVGSGFLSQSTHWLCFGLGAEGTVRAARVRWPDGRIQPIQVGPGRYRVVEGEAPVEEPLREEPAPLSPGPPPGDPPQSSPLAAYWLVEPLRAPELRFPDLRGKERSLADLRGRPGAVLFLAPGCGACAAEAEELGASASLLGEGGGRLLGVAVIRPAHEEEARARFDGLPFPVLLAEETSGALAAFDALHRGLQNRYRGLQAPTSFLLDSEGRIEKVYRGAVRAEDLASDMRRLPLGREERLRLALPFPGRLLAPGFHRDQFLLGALLAEGGAHAPAVEALRSSLAASPGDPEALYDLGVSLAASGDGEGAERAYRQALALRPDLADALNNLAVLLLRRGEADEARRLLERALASEPGNAEAARNLARAHLEGGRAQEAVSVYREALRADPDEPSLWSALGFALYTAGDIDGGVGAYRRAAALAPADPDAAAGLANLLLKRGGRADLPEARQVAEEGAKAHPRHAGLLNAVGLVRMVFEDFAGAEEAYEKAIGADPRSPGPYLNLARLGLRRNDRKRAEEVLGRLLRLDPGQEEARAMLEQLAR